MKNSPLARVAARRYEELAKTPFPGGVANAAFQRLRKGGWVWSLEALDGQPIVPSFGSQVPAHVVFRTKNRGVEEPGSGEIELKAN